MPARRLRRLLAALAVVGALAGLGLLVAQRSGDDGATGDPGRAAVTQSVADHGLPVARRNERERHEPSPLTLAVLALAAALAAAATPRPPLIPVPVVDDAHHRFVAGRLPRRRGPPPHR